MWNHGICCLKYRKESREELLLLKIREIAEGTITELWKNNVETEQEMFTPRRSFRQAAALFSS